MFLPHQNYLNIYRRGDGILSHKMIFLISRDWYSQSYNDIWISTGGETGFSVYKLIWISTNGRRDSQYKKITFEYCQETIFSVTKVNFWMSTDEETGFSVTKMNFLISRGWIWYSQSHYDIWISTNARRDSQSQKWNFECLQTGDTGFPIPH